MQSCWDNWRCLFKMLQSPPLIAAAAPPHEEEHSLGPVRYVVWPDQPDKLKEAIISHYRGWNICWRCCQCDHYILPYPKQFYVTPLKALCDVLLLWCQNPDYTQETWVCAEKAALFSPGMDRKKCSWELLLPWHPGLVLFEERFVGDGELFSSSLRVYFITWLLLGGLGGLLQGGSQVGSSFFL